jgi:hypothetical protein
MPKTIHVKIIGVIISGLIVGDITMINVYDIKLQRAYKQNHAKITSDAK